MNKQLAAALALDDEREDAGMHADDRVTCHTHQAWATDCADLHLPLAALLQIGRVRDPASAVTRTPGPSQS